MQITIPFAHVIGDRIASGGDRLAVEVAKRWTEHQIVVLCHPDLVFSMREELPNAMIITLPGWPLTKSILAQRHAWMIPVVYFLRCISLYSALKSLSTWFLADVFYVPGDFFCNIIPAVFLRKKFHKIVVRVHHINEPPPRRKAVSPVAALVSWALQRFSFRLIRRYADAVFVLNRAVCLRLYDMGFSGPKVYIMGAGIDTDAIVKVPPKAKGYDVVFFGRLNASKGIHDLPGIWREVKKLMPDARLAVIGAGDCRPDVRCDFYGWLPYSEVYAILKASRVFISPSYEEGWGITIAEALACGMRVVAYDLIVYREVFGDAITVVPVGDKRAMAVAVAMVHPNRLLCPGPMLKHSLDDLAEREERVFCCNDPGLDTRRKADKGLETFEKDNSKAVVEAMNDLLTRKPEEQC